VLTEADGGPLAVVVAGANVHDSLLLRDALEPVVVDPPDPPDPRGRGRHLCLDKAFSGGRSDATARAFGYEPHVRPIGEDAAAAKAARRKGERKGHKPRRWVVERTISWLNRCRGILVRYEKKAENYLAAVQLACALLWYRRLHRLAT
jgi:putative transposase